MRDKYLLYIDILGFKNLVENNYRKVEMIYGVLDSLNVHSHEVFRTIAFSDTVLVYNHYNPVKIEDHNYIVWYSIEFIEDLHHRLTGQDMYFRAILTKGKFNHKKLENIDAFYGEALIDAYISEKKIPSLGLFIDDECNENNKYFRTAKFKNDLNFVYLNRSIEDLCRDSNDTFPVDAPYPYFFDDHYPYLAWQTKFLSDIYGNMKYIEEISVREKYLTAWNLYKKRYPNLLSHLVENKFSIESISPGYDFSRQVKAMNENIEYFNNLKY